MWHMALLYTRIVYNIVCWRPKFQTILRRLQFESGLEYGGNERKIIALWVAILQAAALVRPLTVRCWLQIRSSHARMWSAELLVSGISWFWSSPHETLRRENPIFTQYCAFNLMSGASSVYGSEKTCLRARFWCGWNERKMIILWIMLLRSASSARCPKESFGPGAKPRTEHIAPHFVGSSCHYRLGIIETLCVEDRISKQCCVDFNMKWYLPHHLSMCQRESTPREWLECGETNGKWSFYGRLPAISVSTSMSHGKVLVPEVRQLYPMYKISFAGSCHRCASHERLSYEDPVYK